MIDTIVITLNQYSYKITNPDQFRPSANLIWQTDTGVQARQNPTTKELYSGIYKPRLTLSYCRNNFGIREPMLKIELSLPKLIFGNNFAELQYKDFKLVTHKLAEILATMGVEVSVATLAQAQVSAIHYAKNIELVDGSTPYHYIQKIKDANVKLALDVNQTDYRNAGHSYKWHCNSYEVVFYDKIKDLEQAIRSSKRALEKDSTIQFKLYDKFKKRHKLEFLRMEVRLNQRKKIKQLFSKLKIKTDLSFEKLFKPAIAKKILLYYLDELSSKRSCLLDYKSTSDQALLVDLVLNNRALSPTKILQLFGFKKALDTIETRALRTMFAGYNSRSWYRLMADANKVQLPAAVVSPFKILREQLVKFKAVKI